jgi:hypothetical protein
MRRVFDQRSYFNDKTTGSSAELEVVRLLRNSKEISGGGS